MNIGRRTFAFSAASLLALPAMAQEGWPSRPVTLWPSNSVLMTSELFVLFRDLSWLHWRSLISF